MTATTTTSATPGSPFVRLWDRQLDRYPDGVRRAISLGIVVLTTIVLYYQLYLSGGVATQILPDTHMSFLFYVNVTVVSYAAGAAASIVAGISDRYGRANIVTVGLLLTGLLSLVMLPNVHSKWPYAIAFVLIGFVEGIVLVATPALIRDFSPQLGRASAMGFWTLGPVLGSLVVSAIVTNTSDHSWQWQYGLAGIIGLVVFALALVGLRELAPALRDQLMVSRKDRALVEMRARGIDVRVASRQPFRQMLRPDIVGSAVAISLFLIIYYLAVGFFPIFFQTEFGYSQSTANGLGNWFWALNAGALLVVGFVSDLLRVRKPFMILGALGVIAFTSLFAIRSAETSTSHTDFVLLLIAIAVSLGVGYAPWMASFTETVERRNPALTATGLAVWGLIIRTIIAVTVLFVPHVVSHVSLLVEKGPTVKAYAAQYPAQIATAQRIDPATTAALKANPGDLQAQVKALSNISGVSLADTTTVATLATTKPGALAAAQALQPATAAALLTNPSDPAAVQAAVAQITARLKVDQATALADLVSLSQIPTAQLLLVQTDGPKIADATVRLTALAKVPASVTDYLAANAAGVQKAQADSRKQWRGYFFVAAGGAVVFMPLVFLMAGYWSPRRARQAEREHEARVAAELARLQGAGV